MKTLNDSDLLPLLTDPQQRSKGFSILVNQYSQPLYWKIRSIVFKHEDADDILQNTFIKIWSSLEKFEGKSKLSTWLYRIAINETLDFLRHEKRRIQANQNPEYDAVNHLIADDYFDSDNGQAILQTAIASLPDVQRTVFTLRYYDEMKYSEMSKILNSSEGALKASYHIAVQKITDFVKKQE